MEEKWIGIRLVFVCMCVESVFSLIFLAWLALVRWHVRAQNIIYKTILWNGRDGNTIHAYTHSDERVWVCVNVVHNSWVRFWVSTYTIAGSHRIAIIQVLSLEQRASFRSFVPFVWVFNFEDNLFRIVSFRFVRNFFHFVSSNRFQFCLFVKKQFGLNYLSLFISCNWFLLLIWKKENISKYCVKRKWLNPTVNLRVKQIQRNIKCTINLCIILMC